MTTDEQADHTQDPRGTDTGAGYPEEQPGGAQPGVERDGGKRQSGADDAPDTDSDQDGGPGQATGNRDAAG